MDGRTHPTIPRLQIIPESELATRAVRTTPLHILNYTIRDDFMRFLERWGESHGDRYTARLFRFHVHILPYYGMDEWRRDIQLCGSPYIHNVTHVQSQRCLCMRVFKMISLNKYQMVCIMQSLVASHAQKPSTHVQRLLSQSLPNRHLSSSAISSYAFVHIVWCSMQVEISPMHGVFLPRYNACFSVINPSISKQTTNKYMLVGIVKTPPWCMRVNMQIVSCPRFRIISFSSK